MVNHLSIDRPLVNREELQESFRSIGITYRCVTATKMFYSDHPPPHFCARYGEFEATIDIESLEIIEGELPARAFNLVQEWAMVH